MTNIFVCLVFSLFYISNTYALPDICNKGPSYWCQNLESATECNAVLHCSQTVWEPQSQTNDVSERFITLFSNLKNINTGINEAYLIPKVKSECLELPYKKAAIICQNNAENMGKKLLDMLGSEASPVDMCRAIGMCENEELDYVLFEYKMKEQIHKEKPYLVGTNKCTWGPSYWCSNFSTVHTCGGTKATKHCIKNVWPNMKLPVDNDNICKICTDMVTQARDVLESNETQDNLKQVFEGSCELIPLRLITKECIALVDEFIPELVETLASQMNPQVVCSVAGLCNSERIDKLLEEYNHALALQKGCGDCFKNVAILRKRFDTAPQHFAEVLLGLCREMDSYADSCSMLVLENLETIMKKVKEDFTPERVCHIGGQCEVMYHLHDQYKLPKLEVPEVKATDDVPCEFCEKLVQQVRDMLVANTTELEFHKIIKGICNETGKFKDECTRLANDYYAQLYHYMVTELKPHEVCKMIGVCGEQRNAPIEPLVLADRFSKLISDFQTNGNINSYISEVSGNEKLSQSDIQQYQLPIRRMTVAFPRSKASCAICEYFLHYVQVELSDAKTEDEILSSAAKVCGRFPTKQQDECRQFVQQYGNVVIALVVQAMDPASICPLLHTCPKEEEMISKPPSCPLCLLAVEQIDQLIKKNRSEETIRHALKTLCAHFKPNLRTECDAFVEKYGQQIIERMFNNHNAEEICTYLKLCTADLPAEAAVVKSINMFHEKPTLRADANNFKKSMLPASMLETWEGNTETNEIPDNTVNGREVNNDNTECFICKAVFKYVYESVKDRTNKEEIKELGHEVCKHLGQHMKAKCDDFVDKYADLIMSIIADELQSEEACQQLKLCPMQLGHFREEVLQCAVCEAAASVVEAMLASDAVERSAKQLAQAACDELPAKYYQRCLSMMYVYGESVRRVVGSGGARGACEAVGQCARRARPATLRLLGGV